MKTRTPVQDGRGATTRALIEEAARQRFGADGYAKATIRAIAADAGIDPALVMRYFGTKQALFAAAVRFDLRLPDLAAVPRAQVGHLLADHFFRRWEEDDTLMALLRVACTDQSGIDQLRALFGAQLVPAIARLHAGDAGQAALRAALVASQMLGMALTRYILALQPLADMPHAEAVAWIAPTIERYLFWHSPQQEHPV